jgi:TRAP-type uncharacterized transport system substrate-binding protein
MKNKMFLYFLGSVFAVIFASSAFALEVEVSTGAADGSYSKFISQAAAICSNDQYAYKVRPSGGSADNLNALLANDVPAGISQLDVGDLFKTTRDVSSLRLLVPLFPEQVHFVTRVDLGKLEPAKIQGFSLSLGGWKPGATQVVLNTVEDLRGKTVASAGGSYYTAQLLNHPNVGGLGMNLVELTGATGTNDALAGVIAGKYDAAILVSAAPAGSLTTLKDKQPLLKLLPMTEAMYGKLSKFYPNRDSLSYRDMGQGGTNIQTFQVMSALLTPNYTKGPFVGAFANLRKCILDNAEDQASVPRTHPAWRYIAKNGLNNVGNWTLWEAPGIKTVTGPQAPKKK